MLNLAQSDREKECIRYAVFKISNLTPPGAKKMYGFENMGKRSANVEECIQQALDITKSFKELVSVRLIAAVGVESSEDEGELSRSEFE